MKSIAILSMLFLLLSGCGDKKSITSSDTDNDDNQYDYSGSYDILGTRTSTTCNFDRSCIDNISISIDGSTVSGAGFTGIYIAETGFASFTKQYIGTLNDCTTTQTHEFIITFMGGAGFIGTYNYYLQKSHQCPTGSYECVISYYITGMKQ